MSIKFSQYIGKPVYRDRHLKTGPLLLELLETPKGKITKAECPVRT